VGYLVVRVPQSPRAPHQVVVSNIMRFYGRGATGNRILTEGEIAALYERRERWAIDLDQHLEAVVQDALFADHEAVAYLHAFARPFGFDQGFLRRRIREDEMALRNGMVVAASRIPLTEATHSPDLRTVRGWTLHGTQGIRLADNLNQPRHVIQLSIRRDGEARLFGCCSKQSREGGPVLLSEYNLGGNLASFFSVAGEFYEQAGYTGDVDVGAAVTGIRGAHSMIEIEQRGVQALVTHAEGIQQDDHRRVTQVSAVELRERPETVAMTLLRDLFDVLMGMDFELFRPR
jgi:hypothetical protein